MAHRRRAYNMAMTSFIDPVCGMSVTPASAAGSMAHEGETYYFCHPRCLERFRADPRKYLSGAAPLELMVPAAAPVAGTQYICPMDPEVVADRPGPCPKCGMALEPRIPVDDEGPDPELADLSRRFWIGAALGLPLFVLAMGDMVLGWRPLAPRVNARVQFALATLIMIYSAAPLFTRAWTSLRARSPNMFTLIGIGVGAAYGYSVLAVFFPGLFPAGFHAHHGAVEPYFESAATIVVLVLLGQVLEGRARRATTSAIRQLAGLAPTTARLVLPDGREDDVPLDLIQVGDVVRIRPGEKIAVDGVVTQGGSSVDEALLTGEPIPVAKEPGGRVIAGSLNGAGTLLVRADRVGNETFLAQMMALMAEAQRSRAPIQRLVDQVARVFVPVIVFVSILTFVAWSWWGGEAALAKGFVHAVAVLIVACPCALGLATPLAITVGIGRGARAGILVKNAEALEKLRRADVLVLDKTGTLTEGKPRFHQALALGGAADSSELVRLAASLERASEHPLAAALVAEARRQSLALAQVNDFQGTPGQGVRGLIDGATYLFGSARFLREYGVDPAEATRAMEEFRQQGGSVMGLARAGLLLGVVSVIDAPRPTSREAVARLRADGLNVVMLTGDGRAAAEAVARQVGIDDVLADMLPADKLAVIRQLQAEGKTVAMAGDGVNDAAALAQADVGIAMGTGADVAMASADITLARADLRVLVEARALSRATARAIRGNLLLAFFYNAVCVPFAAVGWVSPTWAAAAMSLSSLSVVANSLLPRRSANTHGGRLVCRVG